MGRDDRNSSLTAGKIDDEKIELWTNLSEEDEPHGLTQEDLDDGSFLKYCKQGRAG